MSLPANARTLPPGAIQADAAADVAVHAAEAAALLRALGNEQRLMILCLLAAGESSVGALQDRLDLSQSALSQHLGVLREAAMVEARRDRQQVLYRLRPGPAAQVMATLHSIYCEGS